MSGVGDAYTVRHAILASRPSCQPPAIATIANAVQEQCALGPTIIFEAGTTHPYYITPNLCTIGAHTYSSKKTVRDASPRKVCRKYCEEASVKLALKHVQGLTCYCKKK